MNAEPQKQDNRTVGTVAATASVAALACGVCCVLPLAIPAAMLGSFGALISWFAHAYGWLTPIAVAAVAAGWLWIAYQSKRSGKRPARSTLAIMGLATAMMVLAYLWPAFEGLIGTALRG
ncbi:hypothetical protein OF829_11700 [Sphingomonas sp. LB-2]|uniref:hypothetical protein n=1 Tax=Sphingomonas caeni TaxID=2984949 RepID=UPI002231E348|nr:hypothetical protein [Sphingomonas caeni]MCW3847905.1 hypothetical protein [Sphingomonas caeni]